MSDRVGINFASHQALNESMGATHAGTSGVQDDFATSMSQLRATWADPNGDGAAMLGDLLTQLQDRTNMFLLAINRGVAETHDAHHTGFTRAAAELGY
jgi:hypothetical protein